MPDNSVSLHRVLKASPEIIFRAFTEAERNSLHGCRLTDLFARCMKWTFAKEGSFRNVAV